VGVTRHPTDAWVAQQLREATPFDQRPKYLVRDNDGKFGTTFARVAGTSGIEIVHTLYRVPRANAVCERFLGSVRRECVAPVLAEKSIRPASPAPDGAGVVALSGGCRAIVDGTVAGWTSRPAQGEGWEQLAGSNEICGAGEAASGLGRV
jgi:transposase InsO family protein